MSNKSKPYVEFTLRIPKLISEHVNQLVVKYNSTVKDPTKFISEEAWYIWLIRDWYINDVAPIVQRQAMGKLATDIGKIFEEVYK